MLWRDIVWIVNAPNLGHIITNKLLEYSIFFYNTDRWWWPSRPRCQTNFAWNSFENRAFTNRCLASRCDSLGFLQWKLETKCLSQFPTFCILLLYIEKYEFYFLERWWNYRLLVICIYMYILMHKRQSAPFQESLPNLKKNWKNNWDKQDSIGLQKNSG